VEDWWIVVAVKWRLLVSAFEEALTRTRERMFFEDVTSGAMVGERSVLVRDERPDEDDEDVVVSSAVSVEAC